jgi:cytochrome c biogenesis protein CcdA
VGSLLSTGGLIAAFFAGAVALFAPCCVVFLLPGYLAAAVKNRKWRLIPLTLVFSAGLALVVVPITAGVTMISSFIAANHTILFALGALLMLVFAALSVSGHMWAMPSFMRSPNLTKANYSGFFAFGIFSGIASSCCAPVLAGILTLVGDFPIPHTCSSYGIGLRLRHGISPIGYRAVLGCLRSWAPVVHSETAEAASIGKKLAY